MVNKKGLSAIIAVVLIVLLTVVAVTIVWTLVIPMIQETMDVEDPDSSVNIITSTGYTSYDEDQNILSVMVGRMADDKPLEAMEIIVLFEEGSYTTRVPPIEPNREIVYVFNLSKSYHFNRPLQVSVAAVLQSGETQKIATASPRIEIPENKIVSLPTQLLVLGEDSTIPLP